MSGCAVFRMYPAMRRCVSPTRGFRHIAICVAFLLASGVFATAQRETILYRFQGSEQGDGSLPDAGVIADKFGNLYGTTTDGGFLGHGVVYELSPPVPPATVWTEAILYRFTGSPDGAGPFAGLAFDGAGNLYGTTAIGGASPNCSFGCGTVFELAPPADAGQPWAESVIYSFGGSDGATPFAAVILDQAGNIYGTTMAGGASDGGTVFELSPPQAPNQPWSESVLHDFTTGSDGGGPIGPVAFDGAGNLYGAAYNGGKFGMGTVFKLTPSTGGSWAETVLHNFGDVNSKDGANPSSGLVITTSGEMAGTTPLGGSHGAGTVYGLRPPSKPGGAWAYAVLYNFGMSSTDGATPLGVTLANGDLYGTTYGGGVNGWGTVFQLVPSKRTWRETVLYNFKGGSDGIRPEAGLLIHDSALFGTTSAGGDSNEDGIVFEISR
jgi:uncharacterized repeat protein (TIGR03803 family)